MGSTIRGMVKQDEAEEQKEKGDEDSQVISPEAYDKIVQTLSDLKSVETLKTEKKINHLKSIDRFKK